MQDYHMQPVDSKSLDIGMQILAHNICNSQHPDDQIQMTGWLSHEGHFLVSCAYCKMKVYDFYRKETSGSSNNQQE